MFNFLSETSKISSTRVTLFLCTLSVCILFLAVATCIGIKAYKCFTIDWSGIAVFIGALSAFMGALLYGKVQQKKVELYETPKYPVSGNSTLADTDKHSELPK